ncbi:MULTISPECIES: phage tail protein I [Pseudoalteromonas]|uniref:Phage tail protein I n=1 Tax=Pseudoalteromonas amylolytica TaxID=1859457 RepID=A0A1S1MWK0_9GAMM|nr:MULTISPECIES: phage tail protein I [Pseudoalteromonas]OHU87818.1 phage tail protein I [Pseudoalteromonas sp. JW3]OHU91258.1 phage tail protein I [Pseudoalteromonas amylolytica]
MSELHNGSALQSDIQSVSNALFAPVNTGADVVATLWSPETCPEPLLPWLAWSQGVEQWDEQWSDNTKRQVISQSYEQHKYLGTRFAITKGLQPFGFQTKIYEWFEKQPQAEPGTFSIDVSVTDKGIDNKVIEQIYTTIVQTKRKSVQFDLSVSLLGETELGFASAATSGITATVYPYYASEITSESSLCVALANQSFYQIKVYPRSSYVSASILDHADPSWSS